MMLIYFDYKTTGSTSATATVPYYILEGSASAMILIYMRRAEKRGLCYVNVLVYYAVI